MYTFHNVTLWAHQPCWHYILLTLSVFQSASNMIMYKQICILANTVQNSIHYTHQMILPCTNMLRSVNIHLLLKKLFPCFFYTTIAFKWYVPPNFLMLLVSCLIRGVCLLNITDTLKTLSKVDPILVHHAFICACSL